MKNKLRFSLVRKRIWKTTRKNLTNKKDETAIARAVAHPFTRSKINYRLIYLLNAYSKDAKYKTRVRGHDIYEGLLPTQDERDLLRDVLSWNDSEEKTRVLLFLHNQSPNLLKENKDKIPKRLKY